MSSDLIKFAFIGGEVSPTYFGRSDLEKFDLALAEAENWFVDYHGGLSTSPGTEFIDFVKDDLLETKFFSFKFSSSVANTYIVLLGHHYARFVQDGAYVLESAKPVVSVTKAAQAVLHVEVHQYTTGDWIKFPVTGEMTELSGLTCEVEVIDDNTFYLKNTFGDYIDSSLFTTYVSGGMAARVYTVTMPYASSDLAELRCHQIRDVLRFTHPAFSVRNFQRYGNADWRLTPETHVTGLAQPEILSHVVYNSGTQAVAFAVTQVDANGVESLPSDYHFVTATENYESNKTGSTTLKWEPLSTAKYYKVYRTRFASQQNSISRSYQLGYIGQAKGAHFVDTGIVPDFAQTPPQGNNPFANGRIVAVDVKYGGSGYTNSSVLTVTDPNPEAGGFLGYAIVSTDTNTSSGPIVGVYIIDPGHDYTAPVFSISGGTGAVLEGVLGEASGNYPAVSTVYQQRQIYAAPDNGPLVVFGSKPGQLSNFSYSDIVLANDSFEHEIDSEDVSPIRHLVPTRGGLLVFTPGGIWLMSGTQGAAITATNVQADMQNYRGASDVPPERISTDILFCDASGAKVSSLAYMDQYKLYAPNDMTLLASHLLEKGKRVVAWGYAEEPHRLVWAVRNDGVTLNFTYIKEQQVYAWTRRTTQGRFIDVKTLEEGAQSSVYVMTSRLVNGRHTKFIERVMPRTFDRLEDAFCVDSGLRLGATYPPLALQIEAASGTGVRAYVYGTYFSANDVGKVLRFGGGRATVASFIDTGEVTVDIHDPITDVIAHTNPAYPRKAEAGEWTLDSEITTVTGLKHLEGMAVKVLADGAVINGLTVTGGTITLPQAASRVVVGLGYRCTAKNLPLNAPKVVIENKRKRVVGLAVRVKDTRGLKAGNSLDALYAMRTRSTENYGVAPRAITDIGHIIIEPVWSENAQSYIVQDDPLPATLLGYVLDVEVGDDPG